MNVMINASFYQSTTELAQYLFISLQFVPTQSDCQNKVQNSSEERK